jgi:tetratricopeptide (TPR) repeat protein
MGIPAMRRPLLAVAAGVLFALLASVVVPPPGARASAEDVAELLGDCQDDEIDNEERADICSRLIDDASLPEDLRAEALLNRGIVHLEESDPEAALADFERGIAYNPEYPALHAYRGEAHKALEKLDLALADYDKAIALDGGTSADLFAFRGQIHRRMGSFDKARVDFERALQLEREHDVAIAGMKALGLKLPE